jgi:patatin-related protein
MAMRGGVSLAVWMGGACREVARLRAQAHQPGVYHELLQCYGYDTVTVDVLAGTSAGGLNGVLMAAHLVYCMPFDHKIRNLWLQIGHLELLTRSPDERMPPSLLRGDDVFFERLRAELGTRIRAPDRPRPSTAVDHPVRLILTSTRLRARPDAVRPHVGPLLPVGQSRAHFRFRHRPAQNGGRPGGALSDFEPVSADGDDTTADGTIDCLAYAARSTSSYPMAFEPARAFVDCRRMHVVDPDTHRPVDFRGVCSETGAPDPDLDGDVELIDGGVLDNIPIAWAVRAIAAAPAEAPVDRWLVYLQPVAPLRSTVGAADAGVPPGATRVVALLRRALATKIGTESLLDDAEEMRRALADAQRRACVASRGVTGEPVSEAAFASYRSLAGRAEAEWIVRLLEDPISVVGGDPLPAPNDPYPLRAVDERGDTAAFLDAVRDPAVAPELAAAEGAAHLDLASFRSPLAVSRATALLLDWVRALDDLADTSEWRRHVYAARFAAEVLVAARDRFVLRVMEEGSGTDAASVARQAARHLASALAQVKMPPVSARDTEWHDWTERFAQHVTNTLRSVTPLGNGDATDGRGDWPVDPFAPLWDFLVAVTQDVASNAPPAPGFDAFAQATTPDAARARLVAAEVELGPLRTDPLSGGSTIHFATVSAANASPLEIKIFGKPLTDDTRVRRKLSGNQVANFASFLSARWRASDWVWGRLDAAQSLVETIAQRSGVPPPSVERLRELFVTPPTETGDDDGWRTFLEQRWQERQKHPDTEVNDSNLAEMAVEVATERLQWEILAEEVPLVTTLANDTPPGADVLDRRADGVPAPEPEQVTRFGDIGREEVGALLPRRDLRRAVLRLGLVAWRAMQPAGSGPLSVASRWLTGLLVKPLVWVPTLLALAAPVASIVAGVLTWIGVAVAADWLVTFPAHLVTLAAIIASSWILAFEEAARIRTRGSEQTRWPYMAALAVTVALVAFVIVMLVVDRDARFLGLESPYREIVPGVCAAVAVLVMLWWVIPSVVLRLVSAAVAGILAGLVAWWMTRSTSAWDELASWRALLLLFFPLGVITVVLTYRYPNPLEPSDQASVASGASVGAAE